MINAFNAHMPHALGAVGVGKTQIQKALAILRKFGTNAHVYLPGIGMLNGLQAGNYIDSAGTQNGAVDQPVGLVQDAAGTVGTVGPELVVNGSFSSDTSWSKEAGWSISGGVAIANAAADGMFIYQSPAKELGKTYVVSYTCTEYTAGGFRFNLGGAFGLPRYSIGTFTDVITVTNAAYIYNGIRATGSSTTAKFDNISVREVTGIHATQATTASKPILRRGAVALNPYSGDLNNAAWGKDSVTAIGNVIKPTVANAIHRVRSTVPVVAGLAYSMAAKLSGAGYRYVYLNGAASPNVGQACFDLQSGVVSSVTAGGAATIFPVGDGSYICCVSAISNSTTVNGFIQVNNAPVAADTAFAGDGTSGIYCEAAAIFAGTYTAAQIQALGGIPVTTTAPVSTSSGPQSWQFDGTADYLNLGAPLFQMTDDHCVIAGAKPFSTTIDCDVFGQRNTAATNALAPLLRFGADGKVKALYRDDAGALVGVAMTGPYAVGESSVVTASKVGSRRLVRVNGIVGGSSSAVLGTTTINTFTIGAGITSGALGLFNGNIYPVIVIKGTVGDADLLILEKFVAQLSGVTL